MATKCAAAMLILVLLSGISSSSASPPARMVASVVSNMVSNMASATFKWLWSLSSQAPTKTTNVISGRSMIKFESGYRIETVFDGGKIGIEPYSVQATSTGELIILDSANSNLHRVSAPLSRYSRPKLLAGTVEGYTGHMDGKLREARMNHPKSVAVDGKGNIYVADTMNMAIRKISDTGVITTIAGGRSSRGGHVDGPSEEAKLSDDFEVVYVPTSCSLLVVDRGNQAIREIQLHFDDCTSSSSSSSISSSAQLQQHHHREGGVGEEEDDDDHGQLYDGSLLLGISILSSVGFFGYMLALLHQRIKSMFSPRDQNVMAAQPPYTRPAKPLIPPLIPGNELEDEEESEHHGEFFLTSFFRLIFNAGSSVLDIFSGLLSIYATNRKKHRQTDSSSSRYLHHHHHQLYHHPNRQVLAPDPSWPVHERYMIRGEEEQVQPSAVVLEARSRPSSSSSSRQQNYPGFMGELDDDDADRRLGERMNQEIRQRQNVQQGYDTATTGSQIHPHSQKQQKPKQHTEGQIEQQSQHHHHPYQRHFISKPTAKNSSMEKGSSEQTPNHEILFGAMQEHHDMGMRREAVVIKAVDYSDPSAAFNHHNIRPRVNYMGYSSSSSTNIY